MAREQYGCETNRRKKANCLFISTNCVFIMMVLEKKKGGREKDRERATERGRGRKYLKKGNMKENGGYGFEKV